MPSRLSATWRNRLYAKAGAWQRKGLSCLLDSGACWPPGRLTAIIVGAPAAMVDDTGQSCTGVGAGTGCSSPGNVQIDDAPPVVADNGFGGGFYDGPNRCPSNEGGI